MGFRLIHGDAVDRLHRVPWLSVQCCVTSPPYWGLRDFKVPGTKWPPITFLPMAACPPVTIPPQRVALGLEADPLAYTAHLVHLFRALRHVLSDDGTLWVNLGDVFATGGGMVGGSPGGGRAGQEWEKKGPKTQPNRLPIPGLKSKDIACLPWRLGMALQADGWWLRMPCIWHKPNGRREPVRDRPVLRHEYMLLLTKSKKYYYDTDAIAEPQEEYTRRRCLAEEKRGLKKRLNLREDATKINPRQGSGGAYRSAEARQALARKGTRRRGSVWTISCTPDPEGHSAAFPKRLAELAILAGSRPGDMVLDPFSGAGTTGIAALENGRHYTGIELNKNYVRKSEKRLLDCVKKGI